MCTLLYFVKSSYSSSILFFKPFLKCITTSESNVTHKSEGILDVVVLEYSKMSSNSNIEFRSVYKAV